MRTNYLLALLIAPLVFSGCATTGLTASTAYTDSNQVVLENSQVFTHYSAITDHTYRLKTVVPGNYVDADVGQSYPLIIKIDGQWDFPLVFGAYNCVAFDGQMPQAVVVGVDWGDVEGDIHAIRSRDLMPAPVAQYPQSGYAKNFLRALTEEIIPELERRYRLNGERVLVGGSTGAVFATYALLEHPAAFTGAIAIAGGYGDFQAVFKQQLHALGHTDALAGKRLYMGAGSLDEVAPQVATLAQAIEKAQPKGFDVRLDHVIGYGHSGMNIPGYAAGFQHVFSRPSLTLPAGKLAKHAGIYRSAEDSMDLKVNYTTNGLEFIFGNYPPLRLDAQSENTFYHPGRWLSLTFNGDQVTVDSPSGKEHYLRVVGN